MRGLEPLSHDPGPEAASRAKLGDLFQKVVVGIEEEGQRACKLVNPKARPQSATDVFDPVGQRESHLLNRGGSGLPDVVATDRNRIPVADLCPAKRQGVGNNAERRSWRVDICATRDVFLEDIVLNSASQRVPVDIPAPRDAEKHAQQDWRGAVNRHRDRDTIQGNVFQQDFHVPERADRDTDLAYLTRCQRVIRVQPHLSGQVECDADSGLPLAQKVKISPIGFARGTKAGILPHRPEAPAVHVSMYPAREWVFAWLFGKPGAPRYPGTINSLLLHCKLLELSASIQISSNPRQS